MTYHCFSKQQTRARKKHVCIWCCQYVLVGSRYIREHSVYDGQWQNFAWHEACLQDAEAHFDETREEEFISGNEMPFYALYKLECAA